jgi:hypothetical protein
VQVFELRHQLRFGLEAADEFGLVGKLGQDDFDCYFPLDEWLPGAVNRPVCAFADGFE